MPKDLEIIEELEKKFGHKLDQLSQNFIHNYIGYTIDENDNIIGLNLTGLKISDISSLKDLKNLINLDLERNQISDITFLKDLKYLTYLNLGGNQISDISPLGT